MQLKTTPVYERFLQSKRVSLRNGRFPFCFLTHSPASEIPKPPELFKGRTAFVHPPVYIGHMNAARFFMRREDYQQPQTPADSPFRNFNVSCLHCGSFKLQLHSQFDEDAGTMKVILFCPNCRQHETLPIKLELWSRLQLKSLNPCRQMQDERT